MANRVAIGLFSMEENMPVQRCYRKGMSGFRDGKKGKCFVGPGARAKAAKQGRAIEAAKRLMFKVSEFVEILIRAWQLRRVEIKGTNKNIWEDV